MGNQITLPDDPPKRERMLCIRLTKEEHDVIQSFACQVQQPVSRLARHFILRAIHQYAAESGSDNQVKTNET